MMVAEERHLVDGSASTPVGKSQSLLTPKAKSTAFLWMVRCSIIDTVLGKQRVE